MDTEQDDSGGELFPALENEEYGGPIKSFLEHLEDLRWVLIKIAVSVMMGMIVSLVAGNHLVSFLTWPLKNAELSLTLSNKPVPVILGTNSISRLPRDQVDTLYGTNNAISGVELVPQSHPGGTNLVLALRPMTDEELSHYSITDIKLKNYGPIEAFFIALKLALYGGLVISAPFVIFFTGSFVLPALKISEKKMLYQVAGFSTFLFFLGVGFCYFIIMQVALLATVQFSNWLGFGADEWRADAYISFVCKFMLAMGISFQVPVVLLTMVKIDLLDHVKLRQFRIYWIVINLVICAVLTPSGDPITMIAMAIPLQVLYEISVIIARFWARKDKDKKQDDD